MLDKLFINYEETVSVILFCIGFSTMLLNKNLIKKIIGMDIMPPAGCRRHLERLLGDRGHHGGHFNGRIPQEREAEINQQEPDHSRSGSCFI